MTFSSSRPGDAASPSFAVITPSYRNDLEHARALSASIDAYTAAEIEHILVVPRRDQGLFAPLQSARRRVVTKQELLSPLGFRSLPLPSRLHIPGILHRRIAEQWWHPKLGRMSGWVTQQLIKLSADALTQADVLVFMDSDALLIRPLDFHRFLDGGRVRLHRSLMRSDMDDHITWYRIARRILGLPPDAPIVHNFIGQLVSWRRDCLTGMQRHIEKVHGKPWQHVVAQEGNVAEYILYGVYCSEILTLDQALHSPWTSDLTHSIWTERDLDIQAFAAGLERHHVALHIQSTLPVSAQTRAACIRAAIDGDE
jgi:Family of unknown function (DUF6492)